MRKLATPETYTNPLDDKGVHHQKQPAGKLNDISRVCTAWHKVQRHERGEKDTGHYFVPLVRRKDESEYFAAIRAQGATRFCTHCHGWDTTPVCTVSHYTGYSGSTTCGNVAKFQRTGWTSDARRPYGTEFVDQTHWFCGTHDPQRKLEKREAERVIYAEQRRRYEIQQAKRERVKAATEDVRRKLDTWRRLVWSPSDAKEYEEARIPISPCLPEHHCEHVDCELAHAYDELLAAETALAAD